MKSVKTEKLLKIHSTTSYVGTIEKTSAAILKLIELDTKITQKNVAQLTGCDRSTLRRNEIASLAIDSAANKLNQYLSQKKLPDAVHGGERREQRASALQLKTYL